MHAYKLNMTVSLVKLIDISNLTSHKRSDLFARGFYKVLSLARIKVKLFNTIIVDML